jgi:hypothetical protein
MKSSISKLVIALLIFGLGLGLADYFFRIPFKNSTLTSTIYTKVSQSLNLNQEKPFLPPKEISSSRYQLKIAQKFRINGTFQIAKIDEKNLFVVERFSGESYIWNIQTGKTSNQGKLLIDSGILIEKDKRQIVQITDLHYAFGKLLLSVVSTPKNPDCLFLQALAFDSPLAKRTKPYRFFQSPCIEDTLNPMLFGGRFTNSNEAVYMSVGEQRYDRSGYPKISKVALSEQKNPNSVFGTILQFDKKLAGFSIYSSGHRNAQGMFFSSASKKFYEAEHGPQGGDEVNIVLKGKNYGWPFVSFGVPYGWQVASGFPDPAAVKGTNFEQVLKKSGQVRGTHEGYQKPLFSWFPSVGAGSLLQIPSDSDLLDWRDNLLVVSLASNQLHRLILEGDKVIFDETIDVGARIRDMLVTKSGDLIIALDEGTLLAYRP